MLVFVGLNSLCGFIIFGRFWVLLTSVVGICLVSCWWCRKMHWIIFVVRRWGWLCRSNLFLECSPLCLLFCRPWWWFFVVYVGWFCILRLMGRLWPPGGLIPRRVLFCSCSSVRWLGLGLEDFCLLLLLCWFVWYWGVDSVHLF